MKNKLQLTSRLVYYLLLSLIALFLISAVIGTKIIVGKLQVQSNHLIGLKAEKQALSTEQNSLIKAKSEVNKYASLSQISESIVPQDKDQAEAVREIVNIAQASNTPVTSITFPNSSLGSSTGAPASSLASTSLSLSQLTPVVGIPGVYILPITVTDSGSPVSYANFYNFISNLEQNRRTSQINGLSIQPNASGDVTFTLIINEYIKPL